MPAPQERRDVRGVFFRVDGADLETGEEAYLVLQATTVEEAEAVARKQGLLIAGVRPATPSDWGVPPGVKVPIPAPISPVAASSSTRPPGKVVVFETPQQAAGNPNGPAKTPAQPQAAGQLGGQSAANTWVMAESAPTSQVPATAPPASAVRPARVIGIAGLQMSNLTPRVATSGAANASAPPNISSGVPAATNSAPRASSSAQAPPPPAANASPVVPRMVGPAANASSPAPASNRKTVFADSPLSSAVATWMDSKPVDDTPTPVMKKEMAAPAVDVKSPADLPSAEAVTHTADSAPVVATTTSPVTLPAEASIETTEAVSDITATAPVDAIATDAEPSDIETPSIVEAASPVDTLSADAGAANITAQSIEAESSAVAGPSMDDAPRAASELLTDEPPGTTAPEWAAPPPLVAEIPAETSAEPMPPPEQAETAVAIPAATPPTPAAGETETAPAVNEPAPEPSSESTELVPMVLTSDSGNNTPLARTTIIPVTVKPVLVPKSGTLTSAQRISSALANGPVRTGGAQRPGGSLGKAPVRTGIVPPRPQGFIPPPARPPGSAAPVPGQKSAMPRRAVVSRALSATPPRRIPPATPPNVAPPAMPPILPEPLPQELAEAPAPSFETLPEVAPPPTSEQMPPPAAMEAPLPLAESPALAAVTTEFQPDAPPSQHPLDDEPAVNQPSTVDEIEQAPLPFLSDDAPNAVEDSASDALRSDTALPAMPDPSAAEAAPELNREPSAMAETSAESPASSDLAPFESAPESAAAETSTSAELPAPAEPTAAPAEIPIARIAKPAPAAPRSGGILASLLLHFVLPLATVVTLGGLVVMLFSLFRSAPEGAGNDRLEFRVEVLTQTLLGGVLLITGMLIFVSAGLVMVAGALKRSSQGK